MITLPTPDVFGERAIASVSVYPMGYNGSLRFPTNNVSYVLPSGSSITTQCYHPKRPLNSTFTLPPTSQLSYCPEQMILKGIECLYPCPLSSSSAAELNQAQLAFIVPGFIGVVCCVLVLMDSIALATQTGRRNTPTQVKCVLLGSMLGILYFMLGPLPALIEGSQVSCGGQGGFSMDALYGLGILPIDLSDANCKAQRYVPFILQLCFNLVFFMTTERKTRALVAYCVGLPLVLLITAAATGGMSANTSESATTHLMRQSSICWMWFENVGVLVVLLYLPFITTGILVLATRNKHPLVWGILLLLVIIMVTLAVFETQVESYGPPWSAWFVDEFVQYFECVDTALFPCACTLESAAPLVTPSVSLISATLACMSSIPALFGAFFLEQTVERRWRGNGEKKEQRPVGVEVVVGME